MIVTAFSDLAFFISGVDGIPYTLESTTLSNINGDVESNATWALLVTALLSALTSLFTLFLAFFQNYELQKRTSIFGLLLTVGFLLVYAFFFFYYKAELEATTSQVTLWSTASPLVAAILQAMAFQAIRKKESDILRKAMNFRLRD